MSYQYAELPTVTKIHCLNELVTQEALVTVVQGFAMPHIDYCNSLLYGIFDYNMHRLYSIKIGVTRRLINTI